MRSNVFHRQYEALGLSSQRRYPNEMLIQFLGSRLFHLSPDERKEIKVCEIGSGSGANLWMVAREGFDAFGLELSTSGLRLSREVLAQWGARATLVCGDMARTPFADRSFHVVFDVVSMQHLDRAGHEMAYAEAFRMLRPGGWFFQYHLGAESYSFKHHGAELLDPWTVSDIANPEAPLAHNGPTCFLTVADTQGMLERCGFTDIHVETLFRSYRARTQHIQYLATNARRPTQPD